MEINKLQNLVNLENCTRYSSGKVYFFRFPGPGSKTQMQILAQLLQQKYPSLDFTIICVRLKPPYNGEWHLNKVKLFYYDVENSKNNNALTEQIYSTLGIAPKRLFFNNLDLSSTYLKNACQCCPYCQRILTKNMQPSVK